MAWHFCWSCCIFVRLCCSILLACVLDHLTVKQRKWLCKWAWRLRYFISVTLLAPCSGISALIHNRGQTWHTIWFSLHFEHTKVFAAEKSGFGLYAQCLIVACGRLALSRPAATFTMSSKLGPNREEYRGLATDPGTLFSHLIRSRLLRLIPCNLIRTWLKCTDVVEEFYTKHS
jgi:hypothetical protein